MQLPRRWSTAGGPYHLKLATALLLGQPVPEPLQRRASALVQRWEGEPDVYERFRPLVCNAPFLVARPALAADKAPATPAAGKTIEIKVTDAGFEPREVRVKKGEPVTLSFLRTTNRTCIEAVSPTITPAKAGVEPFHCTAMGMGGGKIIVVE